MDPIYDPYYLMLSTAFNIKKKEETPARVMRKEGFKDFKIKIDLNNHIKEPLVIADGQYLKGEPLSFFQGEKAFSEDIIERRKDHLGRVTVYYKGQEYMSFDNFAEYLNWLGIKK